MGCSNQDGIRLTGVDKDVVLCYNIGTMTTQHGGRRTGAGRPSSSANAKKSDAIVQKKLRGGAELGWEVLGEKYQSLRRVAVELAIGKDGEKPDGKMLKTLLELMPKVVGTDTNNEDSPIATMLREMRVRITAETKSSD